MNMEQKSKACLIILDGFGIAAPTDGNAIAQAKKPNLDALFAKYPHSQLQASGLDVGLPSGQMGNSEVGHNTMGAGRPFKQGIAKIEDEFSSGKIYNSDAWKGAISRVLTTGRTLHFAGIFSDGGVHSHIDHLEQMVAKAYGEGVRKIRIHAIFDGRDVPPQSEPKFIQQFEAFASQFTNADIKIASGGGRMTTVADRYENDWGVVKRGFDMMVWGQADYYFSSAEEGIRALRKKDPNVQDQYLPAFAIVN